MILKQLREPGYSEITLEDGIEAYHKGPPVMWVDDRTFEEFPAYGQVLKAWGYRPVAFSIYALSWTYVRPLPLWLLHVVTYQIRTRFWATLRWLYRRGAIRIASPEGYIVRIRDLRPWPLKGRRQYAGRRRED